MNPTIAVATIDLSDPTLDLQDDHIFGAVYEQARHKLYSSVFARLRNVDDALEAIQDAFVNAYRSRAQFDHRSAPLTWLHKIAANAAIDKYRKAKVRPEHFATSIDEDPAIERQLLIEANQPSTMTAANLNQLLRVLPEKDRELLVAKEVEGLSVEELAARTGLKENTIKVKLYRAREKLVKEAARLDTITAFRAAASPTTVSDVVSPASSDSAAPQSASVNGLHAQQEVSVDPASLHLGRRELQVVQMKEQGMKNAEIAQALGIGESTVSVFYSRAQEKGYVDRTGPQLSDREYQVAQLKAQGVDADGIAGTLGIEKATVGALFYRARRKFPDAESLQQAIAVKAAKAGPAQSITSIEQPEAGPQRVDRSPRPVAALEAVA
jgi:RNA polymerase sigma-70 factor (ECF subfamily)